MMCTALTWVLTSPVGAQEADGADADSLAPIEVQTGPPADATPEASEDSTSTASAPNADPARPPVDEEAGDPSELRPADPVRVPDLAPRLVDADKPPPLSEAPIAASAAAGVVDEAAGPARMMHPRFGVLGVAGINGYGYGIAGRLIVPLARAGDGDNALSLNVDLAATYDESAVDVASLGSPTGRSEGEVNHRLHAFQLPLTLALAWPINTGAVVLTPRLGVVGALRFAAVDGPLIRGFRLDAFWMGQLGVSLGIWLGDGVQLVLGADAVVGPRRDLGADNDTLKDFSRFGLLLSVGVLL